ncbi:uncharacterized protein LOC119117811 isoform X1 [Syngnathus acus]|uniref:uncharacterized protein LOC119117811 isoform X1 n=1 Tax=Syngnathus acus TaxID=161584 RepID=UPI0018864687|nr:uncharacterized protein LOC119117811 isoform X1 [Syngnathus acus]
MDPLPYGISSQLECISRAVLLSQPGDINTFLDAHLKQMIEFAGPDQKDIKELAFRYQEQWESDFLMTISRQIEVAKLGVRLSSSSLSVSRSLTLFGAEKLSIPVSLPYEEIPISGAVDIGGASQRKKSQQAFTARSPSQKETKVSKRSSAPTTLQGQHKPSSQGTKPRAVCSDSVKEEKKEQQIITQQVMGQQIIGQQIVKHPQAAGPPNTQQKGSPQKKPKPRKTPKTNTDNFTCTLEDCMYHKSTNQFEPDKKLEAVRTGAGPAVHKYRGVKKPELGPGSEIRIPYRPKGGMLFDPELRYSPRL